MTFSALNVAVTDLRGSLASFVGPDAMTEVTIRPPVDGGGEISFFRLIAWSYALVFEAGRISIPFLLRLAGAYEQQSESIQLIRALRTWSFHNLGFDSERDRQLSRLVHRWFLGACQRSPPVKDADWNCCFEQLCDLVGEVVKQCQQAVTVVLSSPDDGESVIEDLHNRIERFWPPHKFDALVLAVAVQLGVRIDVVKFRTPRLAKWRSFLANIPEDDDPAEAIMRLMEHDLLEYEDGVLPISGRDVMAHLKIPPGPEVNAMLRHARELSGAGVRDKDELLKRLRYLFQETGSERSVDTLSDDRSNEARSKAMTREERKQLLEEILLILNRHKVRATYSAVACILEMPPHSLGRKWLGCPRPCASWIVGKGNGEPTGYDKSEKHPDLYRKADWMKSCCELRKWLERPLPKPGSHGLYCDGGC